MIMSAIAATTKKHITKVRTPDVDTEPLQILAGMQKGDTLAAFLFIVALVLRSILYRRNMKLLFMAPDQIMITIPLLGPSHHVPSRDQRLTSGA